MDIVHRDSGDILDVGDLMIAGCLAYLERSTSPLCYPYGHHYPGTIQSACRRAAVPNDRVGDWGLIAGERVRLIRSQNELLVRREQ